MSKNAIATLNEIGMQTNFYPNYFYECDENLEYTCRCTWKQYKVYSSPKPTKKQSKLNGAEKMIELISKENVHEYKIIHINPKLLWHNIRQKITLQYQNEDTIEVKHVLI